MYKKISEVQHNEGPCTWTGRDLWTGEMVWGPKMILDLKIAKLENFSETYCSAASFDFPYTFTGMVSSSSL